MFLRGRIHEDFFCWLVDFNAFVSKADILLLSGGRIINDKVLLNIDVLILLVLLEWFVV